MAGTTIVVGAIAGNIGEGHDMVVIVRNKNGSGEDGGINNKGNNCYYDNSKVIAITTVTKMMMMISNALFDIEEISEEII